MCGIFIYWFEKFEDRKSKSLITQKSSPRCKCNLAEQCNCQKQQQQPQEISSPRTTKKQADISTLNNHAFKIRHRGPDISVVQYQTPNLLFVFHRLSINGLKNADGQPLKLGSLSLICNGEIYNYKELKERYNFKYETNNDCECILHLYNHFEQDMAKLCNELRGVFAFALYDKQRDELLIANDPLGIRPLYYGNRIDDNLKIIDWTFASEPIALSTFVENEVSFFPPSHFWSSKTKKFQSYEPFDYRTINPQFSNYNSLSAENRQLLLQTMICKQYRELLEKAVRKRVLNTDRKVAALLSGGVDSSLIVSIAARVIAPAILDCYTIAIKNKSGEEAPDLKFARKVCAFIPNVKHHVVEFDEDEFINALPNVIAGIQSYDITTIRASVGNFLLGEHISKTSENIVILNGDVSEEINNSYRYAEFAPNPEEFQEENIRLLKDVHRYDVLRSARCMEHHGLEPRTPFADRDLVQFVLSIPPELKMFYTPNNNNNNSDVKTNLTVENDNDYHIGKKYLNTFQHKKGFAIEKFLLRYAFSLNETTPYLPSTVLWRPKEAFSDGVSLKTRSWHTILSEHFDKFFTDVEYIKNVVNLKNIFKDRLAHQQNKLVLIKKYKKQLIDVVNSPRNSLSNSASSISSLSLSSSSTSSLTSSTTSATSFSSSNEFAAIQSPEMITQSTTTTPIATTMIEKSDSKKSKSLESAPIYKLEYMIYLLDKKKNKSGSDSSCSISKKSKQSREFHDNYYQQLSIYIKNNIDLFDEKVEQEKLWKLTVSPPIPHTKEACYYRSIYENALNYPMMYGEIEDSKTYLNAFFDYMQGNCDGLIEYYWMPKFVECNGDPSARVLSNYK